MSKSRKTKMESNSDLPSQSSDKAKIRFNIDLRPGLVWRFYPDIRPRFLLGLELPPARKTLPFLIIFIIAYAAYHFAPAGLDEAPRRMLFIFFIIAGLWVTELIPPYATAILAMALQIILLARPGGVLGFEEGDYEVFLQPLSSPIIILFFGGFILSLAATKHGLDRTLANFLLTPFSKTPARILLGVLIISATFSMWMSNTATAAMMIAITLPIAKNINDGDPFQKALILGVAFGANIGGMGTIIGSPPNAIAAMTLSEEGTPISFLGWMTVGVPVTIVMLFIVWRLLLLFFPPATSEIKLPEKSVLKVNWKILTIGLTFALTVALWITESLHGIPSAIVALLPVVIFTFLSIIGPADLSRLDWHILILVAGGISLGLAMRKTELTDWLLSLLPIEALAPVAIIAVFALSAMTLSNFMSNSAAAALIIPIAIGIAGQYATVTVMMIAMAATTAMSMPVSTPPNAIAYSSGMFSNFDMIRSGTIVSLFSVLVLSAVVAIFFLLS